MSATVKMPGSQKRGECRNWTLPYDLWRLLELPGTTFTCILVTGATIEYCDWETFNASCPPDQLIAVVSGRYGRMNLGRCVTTNYGSIGCGADVTAYLERTCSGQRECAVSVISLSQLPLQTTAPCPPEFKYYLEADYECLKGSRHCCCVANKCVLAIESSGSCRSTKQALLER